MKSTGIIRRIDDLGRIVIPKEIRKNLKIKENESLEIFIDGENIILKKYSKMSNMEKTFNEYIKVLNDITGNSIIITNRENVIATTQKENNIIGKDISQNLDIILSNRVKVLSNDNKRIEITEDYNIDSNYYIIPMIANSDVIGLLIMLSNSKISDTDKLSLEIINKVIINSIE